jgi:hypothetical protein
MKLLEIDKRDIWVANEIGFQSFGEPFLLRGIIAPKNSFVRTAEIFIMDSFDEQGIFEIDDVLNIGIKKTSVFWLNRTTKPDPEQDTPTHTVKGITVTTDGAFAVIVLHGEDGYNPLNEV